MPGVDRSEPAVKEPVTGRRLWICSLFELDSMHNDSQQPSAWLDRILQGTLIGLGFGISDLLRGSGECIPDDRGRMKSII